MNVVLHCINMISEFKCAFLKGVILTETLNLIGLNPMNPN